MNKENCALKLVDEIILLVLVKLVKAYKGDSHDLRRLLKCTQRLAVFFMDDAKS